MEEHESSAAARSSDSSARRRKKKKEEEEDQEDICQFWTTQVLLTPLVIHKVHLKLRGFTVPLSYCTRQACSQLRAARGLSLCLALVSAPRVVQTTGWCNRVRHREWCRLESSIRGARIFASFSAPRVVRTAEGRASALKVVRTTGRFTLHSARRVAVDTALKVVWTAGRCQIRGAAGTCKVTSHSEQALLPASRQQPELLRVSHMVALSVSRLCPQPVCRF